MPKSAPNASARVPPNTAASRASGTSSRIPNAYVRLMNPAPTIPIPTDISPLPLEHGPQRGVALSPVIGYLQVLPSGGTVRSMR